MDALAPEVEEGRGRLRNAAVSCEQAFDPRMPEWGNPAGVMTCHFSLKDL